MKNCIVIGSGFGGLSIAALLAKQGHNVTILEKNEQAGGRASIYKQDGFLFDMGPSWYLIREVFQRFFDEFGKKEEDFYQLIRLDPSYRIFFNTQNKVDVSANINKNLELFDSLEQDGAAKLKKYLDTSQYQYDTAIKQFLYKEYRSLFDLAEPKLIKEGAHLHLFENIGSYTKRFFSNEKLRKILEYNIVFLGGSPHNTPALYSLMAHIDFNLGVYYPLGGMGKVVDALKKLAESLNVKIIYNQEVTKIDITKGKAEKVLTHDNTYSADIVVVNADYAHSETTLLERKYQTYPQSYWEKRTIAPSAFIIYLGVNKKIPQLEHHNLFLEEHWEEHFDTIFKKPSWPDNPSYYICCPSKTDPSVAPDGCENIFVLVPVAPGLEDSSDTREQYYQKTLEHIEKLLGERISPYIVTKRIFAHTDFTQRYNAYKGTSLGLSHTLFQSAVFRPKHQSKKVKNLFYTGQYTHPGIGIPMCLISSQILRDEITKQYD